MASASTTSSIEKSYIYDVFISFRGKDLRTGFVDHLRDAFRRSGIIVFKDDKDIQVGERIGDELPKAIQDSKFHIVIFSKRYADSHWCLNELVEILECRKPGDPTFYPIFYHVKPSQVREQKGPVGEAFSVHSENEAAGRWRPAMAEAATLEGWELTNTGDGHEVQFIEKIVHTISQKPYFAKFSVNDNFVGVASRVEKLLLSLQVGFDDVRMIGITGMGGVGKTTLAGVVFNRIANQFDGKSFVQNVRERAEDSRGLQDMQKQILTSVFGDQSIAVPSDFEGCIMMKRRMPSMKVLVVLDDVNDVKQLEALAEPSWFRPGSRIIITSRDRQVLVAHGVHNIHDVSTLPDKDAIRLHSRYAFKTESPAQGYEELSKEVLRYAAGLPLTIKTLSSSLRARPTHVWEDAIKRLKEIPWGDTLKILKISYDALQKDQKDIFLHVACLLKGFPKKKAIRILESLGFHAQFGLSVLEQKSLITFRDCHEYHDYHPYEYHDYHPYDYDDKELVLHDHIEEMGMHIVRSLDPDEPERHKLLWTKDEIEKIVKEDMGTEAIRGIKLLHSIHPAKISQSLRKMRKLCFLYVAWGHPYKYLPKTFDEAGKYLPNSLQFLHWYRYPYKYLPKTFQGDKLVEIEMRGSYIHQLWEGGEKKVLPKLRLLDLSFSQLETYDSAMTPTLKELVLKECQKLVEVNISDECSHLKKLHLTYSTALEKLTISDKCRNLGELDLTDCKSFRELQMHGECPCLKFLHLSSTKLRSLNLGLTPNLEELQLENCEDLEELVMPVECQKLTKLSLSANNYKLRKTFQSGNLVGMEMLCSNIHQLWEGEEKKVLPKLRFLDLCFSKLETFDSVITPNLKEFVLKYCEKLVEGNISDECSHLKKLDLSESTAFKKCRNLEELCSSFRELQMNGECPSFKSLELSGTKLRSLNLGLTPNLEQLRLSFGDMNRLPGSISTLKHLRVLDLGRCQNLEQLPEDLDRLVCLEELNLQCCVSLRNIPNCICKMTRLKRLNLYNCHNLEKLPDDFRRLQSLQVLDVSHI